MGYRNLRTSNLREQRRQQSRLSTQAPVGGSSVGHGSGLRFYDGGELIIDGLNTGMRFWVQELGGGNSVGRLSFTYEDMTNVAAEPAVWSQSDSRTLNLAGPLLFDSTAAEGYGGSNLFLSGRNARLIAGINGASPAQLFLTDAGAVHLSGLRSSLQLASDRSIWLRNDQGYGFSVSSTGVASLQANGSVLLGTGAGGAGWNGHSDGSFYLGSSGRVSIQGGTDRSFYIGASNRAIIQGTSNGSLNMWAPAGGQFNGDFAVAGQKNFIMDHPEKPGHTIKYASTESPISGIEHRGRVTVGDDGTAAVEFPEHFTAIVKDGTDVDVFLQPYGPDPAWCDAPTREGTTVHGEPGTTVAWHALAERTGADFTVVEEGSIQTQPEPQPETEGQQWQQQQPSPPK